MSSHTARAGVSDLVAWRMRALGLWQPVPGAASTAAGSGVERITAVAEHLFALQGQDWNAVRWALGVRAPGTVDADVLAAFDSGALVRSWPMRGTLHVLAAEDLGWMQAATNRRVLAGAAKRREFLGLDDASLHRMTEIAVDRLTGGHALSRDELAEAWVDAGIGDRDRGLGPWRYHVIWWLSQNGLIVAGPTSGGSEPRFRLADEWIARPRQLEGEEALAELAARFTRGRGPILDRDLAWWTGLPLRETRTGLAAASADGRLRTVDIDGRTYWADPEALDARADATEAADATDAGRTLLLPSFDEHLLGYTDRSAVLDPMHVDRIVPGRNGMFAPTVVEHGRVVATWRRTVRSGSTLIEASALPGSRLSVARLRGPAKAWGDFHGVRVEVATAARA